MTPTQVPDKLEFRNGAYAELRQIADVPEGKRRPVVELATAALPMLGELQALQVAVQGGAADVASMAGAVKPETLTLISKIGDAMVLAFVKAWSWGAVTEEVLLSELPGDAYAELRDVCLPLFAEIAPKFDANSAVVGEDPITGAPIVDRGSPTSP